MPGTPRVASLRRHAGIAKCHAGCGCGGTADAERSQRLGCKPMWVRLPPPARWLDSAPWPSIECQCVVSAPRDDSVTQKGRGAIRGLCISSLPSSPSRRPSLRSGSFQRTDPSASPLSSLRNSADHAHSSSSGNRQRVIDHMKRERTVRHQIQHVIS